MKISQNAKCPCGSNQKYKNCCMSYHKGVKAPNALTLMKSRYSAYATFDANYIIKTTHPNNPQYLTDKQKWLDEIITFCKNTKFENLEIIDFTDGIHEAFVTFRATLSSGILFEKSRFIKTDSLWLYENGEINEC